ncbi:MerR family transcriptional regulator [Chloroflexota bacterium]
MSGRSGNFQHALDCHPAEAQPVYSIGIAAELARVHPRTLRMYEAEGLLLPARRGGRRIYSNWDLHWVQCMRSLIHRQGLNLSAVRCLLVTNGCWEILGCSTERREACPAYGKNLLPCWTVVARGARHCPGCAVYSQAQRTLCNRASLG